MFWLSILFSREPSNAVWLQIFFHNLLFFLELLPSSLYTNTHTSPWRVCTVKITPIFPQRSTTIYLRTVYWENGNNETLWGPVGHCIQVNPGPQRHRASSYHLHPSTHSGIGVFELGPGVHVEGSQLFVMCCQGWWPLVRRRDGRGSAVGPGNHLLFPAGGNDV